jgi:calmodulin-lysine N-methyltransferase
MCKQMGSISPSSSAICARALHWSASHPNRSAQLEQLPHATFDVIIASDCLFFKDFHKDLLSMLQTLLMPTGLCLFLQPCRDNTMHIFIGLCAEYGFSCQTDENYSVKV